MVKKLLEIKWIEIDRLFPKAKLNFLLQKCAKINKVTIEFEMPNGDLGTLDSFGRVEHKKPKTKAEI